MKKKGFTLIEITVTFSLIAVVIVLLFEIIISLREIYIKGDFQTTLLMKQGILTKKINEDFQDLKLKSITSCGKFCITLNYRTNDSYNLSLDIENNRIQYHDYVWQLPEGSTIGQVETSVYESNLTTSIFTNNSILKIDIPVTNKLLEKDYGIHILYQYNNSLTTVPTRIPAPADITAEQHQQYSFFR